MRRTKTQQQATRYEEKKRTTTGDVTRLKSSSREPREETANHKQKEAKSCKRSHGERIEATVVRHTAYFSGTSTDLSITRTACAERREGHGMEIVNGAPSSNARVGDGRPVHGTQK